jgi:hypothetical protein
MKNKMYVPKHGKQWVTIEADDKDEAVWLVSRKLGLHWVITNSKVVKRYKVAGKSRVVVEVELTAKKWLRENKRGGVRK